jgi:hypothetical protein
MIVRHRKTGRLLPASFGPDPVASSHGPQYLLVSGIPRTRVQAEAFELIKASKEDKEALNKGGYTFHQQGGLFDAEPEGVA